MVRGTRWHQSRHVVKEMHNCKCFCGCFGCVWVAYRHNVGFRLQGTLLSAGGGVTVLEVLKRSTGCGTEGRLGWAWWWVGVGLGDLRGLSDPNDSMGTDPAATTSAVVFRNLWRC